VWDAIASAVVPNFSISKPLGIKEDGMANDQQTQGQERTVASPTPVQKQETNPAPETDGLKGKKPEELTPDELRLMADTMPGEGPGD
jgi:hypothetical protein